MPIIRKIEIANFRCLKKFSWEPSPGVNCIIGPGDTGKSSILDAIDYCLGARRNLQINDTDFHLMDVANPINIAVTLGALDDALKNVETYGSYLSGFDELTGDVTEEPEVGLETVLKLALTIGSDLEPQWGLVSERSSAKGQFRNLNWTDRQRIAPTRLGTFSENHLSWRRGSILNRISEERADTSTALIAAAREMRNTFGERAKEELSDALQVVAETANELGIPIGNEVKALLDAHSVSISGGTISLHDQNGVPLKGLGLGSSRLLIAGLQRRASKNASVAIVDELEYGLEPHRIIRLIDALGAKERTPPLQAFITTHSPVAVRELSGSQLYVLRKVGEEHRATVVGTADDIQGTIRLSPDALLAPTIIVCEGATEIGLLRGLDQHRIAQSKTAITALGVSLVDGGGTNTFKRANAFLSLGYRTAVLRDSDRQISARAEKRFTDGGGQIFAWAPGSALEDELFKCLSNSGTRGLLETAVELKEEALINDHIKSASANAKNLNGMREELGTGISYESCVILATAAKSGAGWFKNIGAMETVARDVIGPDLTEADDEFSDKITAIFEWAADGNA
ncbi:MULTISPECIES: ATP-dependent nuclease [Bradyrhizobium]|uniref:Predicted ATP-dependent endonuclease of the OLD family, contains P-loop ATPase and TOPRIM domains n=2 Tax=Bradyrhizobium TaxID=374 RepID=A0ABY0QGA4_9BRAD|nr:MULTISPECIES: ATP-binding protein [Bradyrhizobium]SDK27937.1 Predicted ATP-dependent endonuclease of the OLD family, contains P-loop ATPase and TOPRIM domains [Bradyrhizobium ottawaense]SEE42508.1 Predicted ATP-dependent endonuclease of the OLD family, contains P-loop ATPase and TOPRIM domains [Bradyrhizobium lablabi]